MRRKGGGWDNLLLLLLLLHRFPRGQRTATALCGAGFCGLAGHRDAVQRALGPSSPRPLLVKMCCF